MAATEVDLKKSSKAHQTGNAFTWLATILACFYFFWAGISLFRSVSVFINMFSSMGVELPISTRLIISSYRFLFPVLFGGTAALVVMKQFFTREKWLNVSITLMCVVIVSLISDGIVRALYLPLNGLMEKLSR